MSEHELFSYDPQSLKIILYYDDFEVTNEITRRKHKLKPFYYQLAYLYSQCRSKLKFIHLVAVVKQKYMKKFCCTPYIAAICRRITNTWRGTRKLMIDSIL